MAIKDYDFRIGLKDTNEQTKTIPKIKGVLDAIIISTNNPCEISIVFTEAPQIIVFSSVQFIGTKYIPLRFQGITSDGQLLLSASTKMVLNNGLTIMVRGKDRTNLNLTLRCVDG